MIRRTIGRLLWWFLDAHRPPPVHFMTDAEYDRLLDSGEMYRDLPSSRVTPAREEAPQ